MVIQGKPTACNVINFKPKIEEWGVFNQVNKRNFEPSLGNADF